MPSVKVFVTDFLVHDGKPVVFGLTEDGKTACVRLVHMPYAVYIEPGCDSDDEGKTRQWFNERIRPFLEGKKRCSQYFRPSIHLVEREKLCGFSESKSWMVKALYDSPVDARRDAYDVLRKFKVCKVYHHTLDANLVLSAQTGLRCFAWLTCTMATPVHSPNCVSRCDVEFQCDAKRVSMDDVLVEPRLRLASFDIETDGLSWKDGDEIRMISVHCEGRDFLLTRHAISVDVAPDYLVVLCEDEADLLVKFVEVVNELRPVFLAGWNSMAFDTEFVFERAKALGCFGAIRKLSWFSGKAVQPKVKEMNSNAFGQNKIYHDDLHGLIMVDGYILARKSLKMPSYSLKSFGAWIGEAKGDVTYEEMVEAFSTKDPVKMRAVADYCVQDSRLVPKILARMEEPDKLMAMARLAAVPPVYAVKRGQSILTFGLILAEAFDRALVVNPPPRKEGEEDGYQGATVIDPIRGYHKDPVAVLDFASLYPSIMQAYNICLSTFVGVFSEICDKYQFPAYSVIAIDGGKLAVFRREGKEGVFPSILRVLLSRRQDTKKKMKALAVDSVAYNQANAKQLSLKIAANSLYGYLGSPVSQLYEKALAASVTSMGRQSLFQVRTIVQDLVSQKKLPSNVHVVYGDSVTGDTPLVLSDFTITCIGDLEGKWFSYHRGKEAFVPSPPLYVWQDGGFTRIRKVIRHKTRKSVLRITTGRGMVDCTEDHSLIRENGESASPNMVNVGDALLHFELSTMREALAQLRRGSSVPKTAEEAFEHGVYEREVDGDLLTAPLETVEAYWDGLGVGLSGEKCYSKKMAAGLYLVALRLGMSYRVVPYDETSNLVRLVPCTIVGKTEIEQIGVVSLKYDGYVYDLETSSHHFGVGPGSLVVHNTDSVMVKFPDLAPADAHRLAVFLEEECTKTFVPPLRLEFENLFATYLLENKKRYAGRVWSLGEKTPTTVIKGLCVKRRDFPKIVQQGLSGILDILLAGGEDAPRQALAFVEGILAKIAANQVPVDDLAITKELNKQTYKTPPPHLVVSRKMAARNPHDPPKSGDRITFVVLHGSGNISQRVDEFEYVKNELGSKAKFDLAYYALQLTSQCENMMELCGQGAEFQRLAQQYVTTATLYSEGQPRLGNFFPSCPPKKRVQQEPPPQPPQAKSKKETKTTTQSTLQNYFFTS